MTRIRILIFLSVATAVVGLAVGGRLPSTSGQAPASSTAKATAQETPAARGEEGEEIKKCLATLVADFKKGDAKAVAAHWTEAGEYTSNDGATFRGRTALEKAYAESFAKNPDNALDVEVESIRFPSRDNAVAEGHFKLREGKSKELVTSKCSFLFAREDGKWLIAIAREWPNDGMSLRDLEWLIGTWEAKRDGATVTTKYEWTTNKTFIRCQISIQTDGRTLTAMQMIGKMPSTGGLHIWTFEDAGGIGDADITRDGKKWLFAARGSTADGEVITATNIMTPIDDDSFIFQAVERTRDDEPLPDLAPIKVVRVKAKK